MPDENSKMDALLKAYAAKRRAEAGEPLEMSAFTRQMLQNEVPKALARAKNTPPSEPEEKRSIFLLWPRLSLGLACLALFLGLLFWFQPEDEKSAASLLADKESETENLALLDEKRLAGGESSAPGATVDQPVPLDEPLAATPAKDAALVAEAQPAPAPVIASSAPEIPAGNAGTETKGDFTFSESKAIASAEIAQPKSALPAEADAAKENRDELAKNQEFARRALAENTGKLKAETALASATLPTDGLVAGKKAPTRERTDTATGRLYFTQENRQEKYRQNLLSPPQPEVLTAFQWERTENQIRIIDDDGSVYEGQIQPVADEADALKKTATKESFTFSASGTNRALQQIVVFQGTFAVTNLPALPAAPVAPADAEAKPALPASAPAAVSTGGMIQGKVQIGGTTEFEIKARQATP